jgi:GDPmannose 4,6-dehydratase
MTKALITGCTGQDGYYLAKHLLDLGYRVYGGYRRSSTSVVPEAVDPVPMELTEYENVRRAVERVKPDEIYNLAAQSHVGESFSIPTYTADVNYLGVVRLLEVVRGTSVRLYQASTSEMFGGGRNLVESSPFAPRSPYAISKMAAHHACQVYRRAYGVKVCSGILFNHESPLRGRDFVTRKITYHVARDLPYQLANLTSRRDWGHAADYVRAMHMMLQSDPDDYVVATGETHSIQDFVAEAEKHVEWKSKHSVVVATERPWDVTELEGNPEKIGRKLGWAPTIQFRGLVEDMMRAECN